jgi:hypothetical protein
MQRSRDDCDGRDIRNVVRANDTRGAPSYAPVMTHRTRREHTMKRIATIGAVITAFAVAPSIAAGGGFAPEAKPQVSAEVVGMQITNVRHATTAVSVQRHLVQIKLARRLVELRPLVR